MTCIKETTPFVLVMSQVLLSGKCDLGGCILHPVITAAKLQLESQASTGISRLLVRSFSTDSGLG
jgi:hypothetical protein